ncbi:MAG: DNA internalization-related competence protein ComEC/Rec2 [Oscillospiraceae bacterium]|nr:DNA internalization-related competence protein ComEC/Rec2 [Oscillospiraceae bacterium]
MRRLMWLTIGFAAACVVGGYVRQVNLLIVAAAAVIIFIGSLLLNRKWKRLRSVAMIFLGIALGAGWFRIYDANYMAHARRLDEQVISLEAVASDYSYDTDYGIGVDAQVKLEGKTYDVRLYINDDVALKPGDGISGRFLLRYTNRVGEETYHRGNGVFLLGYPRGDTHIDFCEKTPLRFYPAVFRQKLIENIEDVFPSDTAAFAKALLLGERTDMDYETDTAFKVSGISHIIAVSGLHVSILFSLVYLLAGKRRVLTAFIGIPAVLLFAAVAGFTPSITRACLMQILVMLALLFDKEYDPPTALAFAALVMLAVRPMVITSASFQLSVGCMAGIFLFYDRIRNWLANLQFWGNWKGRTWKMRLKSWFCSGVAVTLSAQFFTTPLVAYYFGAVSLVGVVTNLLTLWAVSYTFYGIMAVCLLSIFWSWGAGGLAWLVSWLIRYVLVIAKTLARFPLAAVYTQSVYIVLWAVICYILMIAFLCLRKGQPHVLIACCGIGLCLALMLSWVEPLLNDVRMTVLNVGQGQCILLQADGKSYLIDCGGDSDEDAADLAAETLLSQGVTRLDGLILTHFDRDHAGGAAYLLSRVPADAVFVPENQEDLDLGDTPVVVQEDLTLRWEDNELTVFAPVLSSSSNESGLSVLFSGGNCDILITGDMGTLGETLLLHEKRIPELTALVAGHHGSKFSTGERLLQETTPEYVFISVGDNSYGHPHPQVLERLERYGCAVYRTDRSGTIIFRR